MATAVYPAFLLLNSKEKVLTLNTLKRLTYNMFLLLFSGNYSIETLECSRANQFCSQFPVCFFFWKLERVAILF